MSAEILFSCPDVVGLTFDGWSKRNTLEATRRVAVLLQILNTPSETAERKLIFVEEAMDAFASQDILEVELMALQRSGQGDDAKKRLAEISQQWLLYEQTKHLQGTLEVMCGGAVKRQRLEPGVSTTAAEPFAAAASASASTSSAQASTRSREETLRLIEANKEAARMRKKTMSDQAIHENMQWFL
jgi:hypothetical protein